jgi:hypothetical protein
MQMKQFFLVSAIATCFLVLATGFADEREEVQPMEPTLPWLSDMDEALEAAKKTGKPILLEFR